MARVRPPLLHQWLLPLALLLPCAVLVVLGVRLIGQGAELAQSRRIDERRRAVAQVAEDLLARLERIRLDEAGGLARAASAGNVVAGPRHPEVALVGEVRDGRLLLPWDLDPRAAAFGRLLGDSAYGRLIAEAEEREPACELARIRLTLSRR